MSNSVGRVGYLAARDFENDLAVELGDDVVERHGRLFLVDTARAVPPAWAQNIWYDVQTIDVSSISDAARKLRALGKWWALEPQALHRRAGLIQEQLPKLKFAPLEFLQPLPERPLGAWMLIENSKLLAAAKTSSLFPSGEVLFKENKAAPSRAYLKLWELFTIHGVRPKPNERCLELGASPGGWTWVLAQMGCAVTAVDRSPLAPEVDRMPGVQFRSGNAFAIQPESLGLIDWLFSDLICYPEQLEELVQKWLASGLCRNFVCTIKFQGPTDFVTTQRLAALPGAKLHHMSHNKHELTWWLLRGPV